MNVNNLSYRQWQKRNTDAFQKLSKAQQKIARDRGYRNIGWQSVQDSWNVLQRLQTPSIFDAKLKRGDLNGAINQSILEAEQAQKFAQDAITSLGHKRQHSKKKAKATLKKFQLL